MTQRIAKTTAKRISAAEAASMVRPGMVSSISACRSASQEAFDVALAGRANELTDVNIRSCVSP